MKDFYHAIAQSEARHSNLFVDLAKQFFAEHEVDQRVTFFLEKEAEVIAQIPPRPALH
jgi:tRNA-(ms[2]io[6]A)-hydroxylase